MKDVILQSIIIVWVYMTLWSLYAIVKKRNDVADFAWGLGFPVLAMLLLQINSSISIKALILTLLVAIWGVRLAVHIYPRLSKKDEDFRYAQLRAKWGKSANIRSYFQVFMLQGLFLLLISASTIVVATGSETFYRCNYIGLVIWAIGFIFEAVGDRQLSRFIKNPSNKGKIMTTGLWRYTRHPNYFGEIIQWWGLWLLVIGVEYWQFAIISPITITILIYFVSGVPLLEKKYKGNQAYEKYAKKTSKFFPLPPKK